MKIIFLETFFLIISFNIIFESLHMVFKLNDINISFNKIPVFTVFGVVWITNSCIGLIDSIDSNDSIDLLFHESFIFLCCLFSWIPNLIQWLNAASCVKIPYLLKSLYLLT